MKFIILILYLSIFFNCVLISGASAIETKDKDLSISCINSIIDTVKSDFKGKSSSDWTVIYIILLTGFFIYFFFWWLERFSNRRYFDKLKHQQEFERKMRLADIKLEKKRREFEREFINLFEKLLRESFLAGRVRVRSEKEKSELKNLFRSLALKYHPDKSRNESERKLFEFLMKKINEAHSMYDLNTLKHIDELYEKYKDEIIK